MNYERISQDAWDYVSGDESESWEIVVKDENGDTWFAREIRDRQSGETEYVLDTWSELSDSNEWIHHPIPAEWDEENERWQ